MSVCLKTGENEFSHIILLLGLFDEISFLRLTTAVGQILRIPYLVELLSIQ